MNVTDSTLVTSPLLSRLEDIKQIHPQSLHTNPLFSCANIAHEGWLSHEQSVARSVQRAKAIVKAYNLTAHDVLNVTQLFWDMHASTAGVVDTGAGTLVTIQINLFAGTLAKYADDHPAHKKMLDDVLNFNIMAQYCLTEIDHGLDAINIETTATMQADGSFLLHTPHPGASKIMPPTAPCGTPMVGIIFAKLIVKGKDHGIRAFIVQFNDGFKSYPGVVSRALPPRGSSPPVLHSITSFNQVKLPHHALLGSAGELSREALRENHLSTIWRTAVGALALGSAGIPIMERTAFIAGRYSQRRTVGVTSTKTPGLRVPILHFRTQHGPILTTLAYALVCRHFWRRTIQAFTDDSQDMNIKMAWASVFKVTTCDHAQRMSAQLASRCGAQGLFYHNHLSSSYSSILGLQIAEGDVLGLCIRLASEMLLGRYALPDPQDPNCILARREQALLDWCRGILITIGQGQHRGDEFNHRILPHCERIVHTIGHRLAYEAAVAAGEDPRVTDLYAASVLKLDHAHDSNVEERLNSAMKEAIPCLDDWLDRTGAEPYCQVPILTKENWEEFVERLPAWDSSGFVTARL